MSREKLFQDKKKMPRINKKVAQNFVRHELWTPKNKKTEEQEEQSQDAGQDEGSHINKKRRRE